MFQCHCCGSTDSHTASVDEVFQIEGSKILVKHVPALLCDRCGEATFSRETTEKVRRIVRGGTSPVTSIQMDVFDFAS